ncbi:unnamed protein product, partial [Cuscuta europaea]
MRVGFRGTTERPLRPGTQATPSPLTLFGLKQWGTGGLHRPQQNKKEKCKEQCNHKAWPHRPCITLRLVGQRHITSSATANWPPKARTFIVLRQQLIIMGSSARNTKASQLRPKGVRKHPHRPPKGKDTIVLEARFNLNGLIGPNVNLNHQRPRKGKRAFNGHHRSRTLIVPKRTHQGNNGLPVHSEEQVTAKHKITKMETAPAPQQLTAWECPHRPKAPKHGNLLSFTSSTSQLREWGTPDGVYGSEPPDPHTQKNRKHKTLSGALVGQGTPVGRKGANSDYGPEPKEPECPRRPRPRRPCPRRPRPRRPQRPHRIGFYTYPFVQPISGFVFGPVAV